MSSESWKDLAAYEERIRADEREMMQRRLTTLTVHADLGRPGEQAVATEGGAGRGTYFACEDVRRIVRDPAGEEDCRLEAQYSEIRDNLRPGEPHRFDDPVAWVHWAAEHVVPTGSQSQSSEDPA